MNVTALCFDLEDTLVARPSRAAANVAVEAGEDSVTGVAGVALWGPLLDRLGLVDEADRRGLRPIGPNGYSGGECYRALVEVLLAGGDFLSDRSLLADEATGVLRGAHRLPSTTTLWRFCAGADLGRVAKAAAVNRAMLARAWAMGAAPSAGLLTVDADATLVATYGPSKEGSTFTYRHDGVALSPMLGVLGETGDVLAVRARGGNAEPGRAITSFVDECVGAIPAAVRDRSQLWFRLDSAGYQHALFERAARHSAAVSVTARQNAACGPRSRRSRSIPTPRGVPPSAPKRNAAPRSPRPSTSFGDRVCRLIVRRLPRRPGEQLSFDDLDAFHFRAVLTNIPPAFGDAATIEHHHRLRGGTPEEAIRQLKEDFGLNHAPLESFPANWLWWQATALAYNTARWLRTLALPAEFAECRGKRLRLSFLNVAARIIRTGRRLILRLPRAYRHAGAFIAALNRLRALPAFA